ncbi:hypothetical protein CEXT_685821 [Caerostris extrusa]|uniref:Uncharacterized protein n=1 Tax=Caerostris extrusa TaxID=172846 RepID=A0AAV4X942_CAEEX|nr:hypothetical protein CEXT_685821 [Caerostris extrusa]
MIPKTKQTTMKKNPGVNELPIPDMQFKDKFERLASCQVKSRCCVDRSKTEDGSLNNSKNFLKQEAQGEEMINLARIKFLGQLEREEKRTF